MNRVPLLAVLESSLSFHRFWGSHNCRGKGRILRHDCILPYMVGKGVAPGVETSTAYLRY